MNKFIIILLLALTVPTTKTYSDDKTSVHLSLVPKLDTCIDYRKPGALDINKQTKGYYCEKNEIIGIVSNNDTIGIIEICSPSVVAIADKEYPWGWFQFPSLGINKEGNILVGWQMKNDSAEEYNKRSAPNNSRISFDNGNSWEIPSKDIIIPNYRKSSYLPNGDTITLITPKAEDIATLSYFPSPIYTQGSMDFFYERDLPDKFRGIYLKLFQDDSVTSFHAKVNNENLIRAVKDYKLFTYWSGKLIGKNNEIYACVYPSYYLNDKGIVDPIAISFYKSSNLGRSWSLQGKIKYQTEQDYYPNLGLDKKGFSEPTFEFLNDESILCVMRTSEGKATPMYKSYSSDYGINWSIPEPITPNGVMPQLIRLDQDILVMASGRPGIQVRLSLDGKGNEWSCPIELIDYDENKNWVYNTCGYPFLYKVADNEVYIVYSDFRALDSKGESRKSIVFRKIKVYRPA